MKAKSYAKVGIDVFRVDCWENDYYPSDTTERSSGFDELIV